MPTGGLIIPPGQYRPPGRDAPLFPAVKQAQRVRRHLEQIAREAAELDPAAMQLLLPVLQDARKELIRDLKGWLQNVPDGNERFTAQRYRESLVALEGTMTEMGRLNPAMNAALRAGREMGGELAVGHTIFEMSRMASVFGGEFSIPQIDTALVLKAGRKQLVKRHRTSAARYTGRVIQDLQHQFAVGLARGETFHELTERMRRLGGPRGLVALKGVIGEPSAQVEEIAEGLFRRHRHWAERIVRTETMNAYNVQHAEAIDQVNAGREEDEPALLKRWDASLDKRLCQICADLDRRAVPTDKEFTSGVMHPPAHPNCRCVVTAWDTRWGNIKGEEKAITEGKKAAPVQQVKAAGPPPARPAKPRPFEGAENKGTRISLGRGIDFKTFHAQAAEAGVTPQQFAKMFEAPPGYRVEVTDVRRPPAGLGITWGGDIYDNAGKRIGDIARTLTRTKAGLKVEHDFLWFGDKSVQGKGIGSWMVQTQFKHYEALGFRSVEVGAANVGKYYWAKVGFEMEAASRGRLLTNLRDAVASRYSQVPKPERDAMIGLFQQDPSKFARIEGLTEVEYQDDNGKTQRASWNRAFLLDEEHSQGWRGKLKIGTKRWRDARKILEGK